MRDIKIETSKSIQELIHVDENDNIIGFQNKDQCHQTIPLLHRAFSIHIFNSKKKLLIHKRSFQKKLWPGYWSNSVCSHPLPGESYKNAALRRMREEIGISAELKFLYKFEYFARYKDKGSEHELCSVFIGRSDRTIIANPLEIAEWKFINPKDLDNWIEKESDVFTPWFLLEWKEISANYNHILNS